MPPSHCPKCGATLRVLDLLPVLSFIFLKGRCRACGEKISFRYPLVEILTAVLFVVLFSRFSLSIDLLLYLILSSLLILVTFTDLEKEIIPDSVSILGAIPALLISLIKGTPADSLLGMALGFSIMWVLFKTASFIYRKEAMGEGDLKLAMMIGAYLGWQGILVTIFLSFISGAFFGVSLIAFRKKQFGEHIPFGPFLALGALISIFFGSLIWNWYLGMIF